MKVSFVLGIDCSTQSVTLEVRDVETFHVVDCVSNPLPATQPPVSEQNPETWWDSLAKGMRLLHARGLEVRKIRAISVAGQCHGLVPLDRECTVIRPAKLWNDTTSALEAEMLVETYGKEFWVEKVGFVPNAAHTVSKLLWLARHEVDTLERISKILLPHDYLTYRLTGQFVTDRSEASGTGYFDGLRNVYLFDLVSDVISNAFGKEGKGIPSRSWHDVFPEVLEPSEAVGSISPEAAVDLGLASDVIVAVGGGDQHLGAVGIGLDDGDMCFSIGTSGVTFSSSPTPVRDYSGDVDGVCNATGGWLPLTCTLNSTKVTDTVAKWLGVSVQELGNLAESMSVSCNTPLLVPFFDGERSPSIPNATGLLEGLTNGTTREDLAFAAFEGVVMGLYAGSRNIRALGSGINGVNVAVGGGAKSDVYCQLLADFMGEPVSRLELTEATARGACVQALAVMTGDSIDAVRARVRPTISSTFTPKVERGRSDRFSRYLDMVASRKANCR
ncbi:xylulokinase [Actinobaculum massiliense]|uniref:xylulokinase n=1 Tax=Actinobaculum massiliense TaxID=202789 RepID=UPI00254E5C7B|nr:xylulokinase [Actinobaculum massiliense]MDK8319837.1 xylulokinase [Actinobaculum massiliense]